MRGARLKKNSLKAKRNKLRLIPPTPKKTTPAIKTPELKQTMLQPMRL